MTIALSFVPLIVADARGEERPAAFPPGEETCFGRVYDQAHLKAHPDQQVTSFFLWNSLTEDLAVEYLGETSAEKRTRDLDPNNRLRLDLTMRLRDRKDMRVQTFECLGANDSIFCGIDCDGGYFTAKAVGDTLTITNDGFQFEGVCDGGFGWLDPGKDDKLFVLNRLPASACLAERERGRPSLAKAGPPLRERLGGDEPACYQASYGDDHLAAHKDQSVTDIWLVKHGQDSFDLGICKRGADCYEQKLGCWPNTYSWSCFNDDGKDGESSGGRDFPSPVAVLTRAGKDALLLRNHRNNMARLLDTELGAGDDVFKLTRADDPNACGAEVEWEEETGPQQQ